MKKRVLLYLLLILLLFGCTQRSKVIIKDMVVGEVEEGKHALSLFVVNHNQEIGDCWVKITLNNKECNTYDLGVIKPNKEKFFETTLDYENGKTAMDVFADCEWITQKEADACGDKKGAERTLCRLTLDKPKLKQCLEGDVIYYKFFCIALINNDPKVCDRMILPSKKVWCRAYVTKDINLCESISNEEDREECYVDIGMNFKDKSICDKITDEKSKNSCTAVATKNPELCLKGREESKLSCILNIVESTSNKDLCNLLDTAQKEECLEQIK